jgi:acyl-CoA synthetase (AMP-forming)/AMP-acid ligase II
MEIVRASSGQTKLREYIVTSFAEVLPAEPTLPLPPNVQRPRLPCADAIDLLPALRAIPAQPPFPPATLDDIAAINYTGGTTGIPKGCIHTQCDMIYTAAAACTCIAPLTPHDINICFLPIFWIAGEDIGIVIPIFSGSTCVLLARWDPVAFMAAIDRYKVTDADGTVDAFVEVMNHPEVERYDLRSLRMTRAVSFVKALTKEYRDRWRALTGSTMIQATYGSTETHTMDVFTRGMQENEFDLRPQSSFIGLPVLGTEVKICDFQTGEIKPLGADGEICVRSPSVMKGYWKNSAETRVALTNGWFHTGDIGRLDEAGYLHYLGRGKEMLKVNGMSVFPTEVEGLLGRHPAVTRVGVTGIPDEEKGEVPVAFIILAPEWHGKISEAELVQWCRNNMATYKVPAVHFVDVLPMTATGKVRRKDLPRLLSGAS